MGLVVSGLCCIKEFKKDSASIKKGLWSICLATGIMLGYGPWPQVYGAFGPQVTPCSGMPSFHWSCTYTQPLRYEAQQDGISEVMFCRLLVLIVMTKGPKIEHGFPILTPQYTTPRSFSLN